MLTGFEDITQPLTEYEQDVLLPVFVEGFMNKFGRSNAVTNKQIVERLKRKDYKVSDVRVRKIINHIRANGLINGLIATSDGYYISTDPDEIKRYIDSLEGRISAINQIRDTMIGYLATAVEQSRYLPDTK